MGSWVACFGWRRLWTSRSLTLCSARVCWLRERGQAPSLQESWTGRPRAAQTRARTKEETASKKYQPIPVLQNGALKPYLLPKVGPHDGNIVFCETSYYFMLKVIAGSGDGVPVTLLVRGTAFLDRIFQTVVEILMFPAFGNLGLIIEFDFVGQQAGKTLRLAMDFLIVGRGGGNRQRLGCGLRAGVTDGERLGQRNLPGGARNGRRGFVCRRCGCHRVAKRMRGEGIVESGRLVHRSLL